MIDGVKQWDYHKILQLFSHDTANEILAIPLLEEVTEDCLVWKEEHNGRYSVKTGYKLLMSEKVEVRRHRASNEWRNLWRIRAMLKAKHLLWRICRHCLPTKIRLRQHYVQCPPLCQLCEEEEEDDWHVLFGCAESKQCWEAAGLRSVIEPRLPHFNEATSLLLHICSHEEREVAGRVAVMVWLLWTNRNNWLWNNEKRSATQLGMQAVQVWNEWFIAQNFRQTTEGEEQVQQQLNWQPPRVGWLKCKFDAGFKEGGRTTNRGWCIHDAASQFVYAGTAWDNVSHSIIEAEATALKEAIFFK